MMNGFLAFYFDNCSGKEPNNEKPIISYYSVTLQKENEIVAFYVISTHG